MFGNNSFQGKRILVTGAGSGIGRATAIHLGELGANLILVGRNYEKLAETKELLSHGEHVCVSMDLSEFDKYSSFFDEITSAGKLDGLAHCAGIAQPIPLRIVSEKQVDDFLNTNFKSLVFLTKYYSKKKYSTDGSSIVYCSAANAHYPQNSRCMSIYEASKMASEGFVRGIAAELYESRKIRINAMVIGPVATPLGGEENADISLVGKQSDICPNLMGIAAPSSIASMAVFLLSDFSDYSTGRNFFVDGGIQ